MWTYVKQPIWSFVCQQIFGPIMPFVSIKDADEAISVINDRFSFIDCRTLFNNNNNNNNNNQYIYKQRQSHAMSQWRWLATAVIFRPSDMSLGFAET